MHLRLLFILFLRTFKIHLIINVLNMGWINVYLTLLQLKEHNKIELHHRFNSLLVGFFFLLMLIFSSNPPVGCVSDLQRHLPARLCGGFNHLLCGPGQEPTGALQSGPQGRMHWSILHNGERGSSWLAEQVLRQSRRSQPISKRSRYSVCVCVL